MPYPLIVVDGANLMGAWVQMVRESGAHLDFRALRERLTSGGEVPEVNTRWYMSSPPKNGDDKSHASFALRRRMLERAGWTVISVPATPVMNGDEVVGFKGDMDMYIAVQITATLILDQRDITELHLVTGDRDFIPLVEMARTLVIPVHLWATSFNLAADLRRAVESERVHDLTQNMHELVYRPEAVADGSQEPPGSD